MTSMTAADLQPILQEYGKFMQLNLVGRTSLIHGSNHTCHKVPDELTLHEWAQALKLWHTNQGHIISECNSYYNSDRDPITCPYHLINVPGPNAEHGIEIKWH